MKMLKAGDLAHREAMKEMQELMETPTDIKEWFENKQNEFDAL